MKTTNEVKAGETVTYSWMWWTRKGTVIAVDGDNLIVRVSEVTTVQIQRCDVR